MFGAGSVLTARKTWWDFAVDVSGPAENPVGTDHTFTLTVLFSDGMSASGPSRAGHDDDVLVERAGGVGRGHQSQYL